MPTPTRSLTHPPAIALSTALALTLVTALTGCGAQIRPDGPKRVVFTNPDGSKRVVEVTPATQLRQAAIDRLIRMTSEGSPQIRANAIEALSPVQDQLEPIVALALTDPNAGVRSVAAMVAGKSNLSSLAPTIETMTHDPSPYVRSAALFALARFGREVDISELSVLLLENPDSRVRSQAAFILGELGEASAIPMLQQAATQQVPEASTIEKKIFRLQIAEALFKLGYNQSIDTIRAALYPARADELEATALAVQIIGQVRDEASIDQLIYLSDPKSQNPMPAEVRLGVALALARMGHREGSFVADEYTNSDIPTVRAQSAVVLGETSGRENLGKLEVMMVNDPSPLAQVAAAGGIVDYTQRQLSRTSAND